MRNFRAARGATNIRHISELRTQQMYLTFLLFMDFWQCLASLKCTVIFEMLPQTFNVGIARELKAFVVFSTTSEKEIQPDFPRDKNYQRLVHALGWIMTREESGRLVGYF